MNSCKNHRPIGWHQHRVRSRLLAMLLPFMCMLIAVGITTLQAYAAPKVGVKADGSDNDNSTYNSFRSWLGNGICGGRVTYTDNTTFASIASPYYLSTTTQWINSAPNNWEDITVGLVDNAHVEDFNYNADTYWTQLATLIKNAGIGSHTYLRIGPEFNGNWFNWSAGVSPGTPTGFAAAFRRAALAIKAVDPTIRIVWEPCFSYNTGYDWTTAYPGDDVVDVVGFDIYDNWNPNGWSDLLNGDPGLNQIRAFAQAHGKPEAYTEWGLASTTNNGHGDDTSFIQNMYDWMNAPGADVEFQNFWDCTCDNMMEIQGPSANAPNSAALYKSLFGATTTAHTGTWVAEADLDSGPSYTSIAQAVSVSTNTNYTASVWVKGTGKVEFDVVNSAWTANLASIVITGTGSWQKVTVPTFNSGSNSQVNFQLYDNTGGAAGTLYADDCFLGVSGGANKLTNAGFESGDTGWSHTGVFSIVMVDPAPAVPAAPTGLGATAGNAQVALSWTASPGATSYNIYRGTSSGGESATAIATGVAGTTYTNSGLANGTKYYYKVKAVNGSGESGYSNEASATPISPNVHTGTWAAKAVVTTSTSYTKLSQDKAVSTNTNYVASIWVKGSGKISFAIVNSGWTGNLATVNITATGSWQQITLPSFNTGSNSTVHIQLYDNVGGTAGTMYLDDCFLGLSGGSNLTTNPGFESGNTGWTYSGTPNVFSIVHNP